MHTHSTGFTLVELMIVVLISALMMAIAPANFSSLIMNNHITSETNRILSDIQLARSEAMKRGGRVILCRSANTTAATPSCGGTANTWSTGWLIFASGDANSTYEAASDTLIRIGHAASDRVTIKTNSTSNANLEYRSDASTNENGNTAIFVVCDQRGATHGNELQVPPVGRPRLMSSVSSCTSPS